MLDTEFLHKHLLLTEMEQDPMVLEPSLPVLCLPSVCRKLWSKNEFNQRSEKCGNKGQQSKETK